MKGLPETCQLACSYAFTKLEDIFYHLNTGDISYMELEEIKRAQDAVKLLCEAANENEKTKQRPPCTLNADWMDTLEGRLQEYEEFNKDKTLLLHLCQKIPRQVAGM